MDQNVTWNNINGNIYQLLEQLRVLVIDDNIDRLKNLSSSLEQCKYKVKAISRPTEALEILRKKDEIFNIVLTDVEMQEMDGFQLLEIINIEMDIPVIMISASDNKELVMKAVQHGAQDYLVKPVRMEELKNIWQHVVRKNMFNHNHSNMTTTRVQDADNNSTNTVYFAQPEVDEKSCPPKKPRVSWSDALHHKFMDAYEKLGPDAVPKKILELMNEPSLNRENVASHLQKYRKETKKGKNRLSAETNVVAQDQISTRQDINGKVVKINRVPFNSNQNQCLIQQNQQLSIPPTYGNYFHQPQPPVFTQNPPIFIPNPSPLNKSLGFNTPNHSLVPSIDSKYASIENVLNSTTNNYVGIHQLHNVSCPNSNGDPNLQGTICQPPATNIHSNHMASSSGNINIQTNHMASSAGNMTGFEDPSLSMGGDIIFSDEELIYLENLLHN